MSEFYTADGYTDVHASYLRDLYAGIFGSGTYILSVGNQVACTADTNVQLKLSDGVIVCEGAPIIIEKGTSDTVTIPTGTDGTTAYYAIGYKYTKASDGTETAETFVQSLTSASAVVSAGSLRDGTGELYAHLYTITQTGTSISAITQVAISAESFETTRKAMEWHDEVATYNSNRFDESGTPRCVYNGKMIFVHFCLAAKIAIPAKTTLVSITPKDSSKANYGVRCRKGSNSQATTVYAENGNVKTALAIPAGYEIDCDYMFLRS